MPLDPGQPEPRLRDDGDVEVFCDKPGAYGVSATIGDKAAVVAWIAELANIAGLEVDDSTLPDSIVVSIAPGS